MFIPCFFFFFFLFHRIIEFAPFHIIMERNVSFHFFILFCFWFLAASLDSVGIEEFQFQFHFLRIFGVVLSASTDRIGFNLTFSQWRTSFIWCKLSNVRPTNLFEKVFSFFWHSNKKILFYFVFNYFYPNEYLPSFKFYIVNIKSKLDFNFIWIWRKKTKKN